MSRTNRLIQWLTIASAGASLLLAATGSAAAAQGATNAAERPHDAARTGADKTATDFVRHFFVALDAGNAADVATMVEPGARVVRPDAVEQNVVARLKDVVPAVRRLGNFEIVRIAPVTLVIFDNNVAMEAPDREPTKTTFRETWILETTPAGLRLVRASYTTIGNPEEFSFPALDIPAATGLSPRDQPAADFVERFFYTYPHYQVPEMQALFQPGAKILHYNGTEQTIDALAASMVARGFPTFKHPWPARSQMFGNYRVVHLGPVVVVTFDNHVLQWRFGNPHRENAFRETWILRETSSGLRAVWATYSAYYAIPGSAR